MREWLPIVDYATKTGLSISTIRRRIRSRAIQSQMRDGKYFIQFGDENQGGKNEPSFSEDYVKGLSDRIEQLQEENAELRMLVEILTRNTLLAQ